MTKPAPVTWLERRLRDFARDERGVISIEMVIWLPLILAVLGAAMALFEANRQVSLNVKAAYTISDALSRQTEAVDAAYLDGMHEVLRFLTDSEGDYALRVTMVRYDADDDRYTVDWSQTRGSFVTATNADLARIRDNLPQLLDNERVIVVETETEHVPRLDIPLLTTDRIYNFVFTRPRFAPQVVWAG